LTANVAQYPRRLCARHGVNQAGFARGLGVDPSRVNKWMRPTKPYRPSPEKCLQIAAYFGVEPAEFLTECGYDPALHLLEDGSQRVYVQEAPAADLHLEDCVVIYREMLRPLDRAQRQDLTEINTLLKHLLLHPRVGPVVADTPIDRVKRVKTPLPQPVTSASVRERELVNSAP